MHVEWCTVHTECCVTMKSLEHHAVVDLSIIPVVLNFEYTGIIYIVATWYLVPYS